MFCPQCKAEYQPHVIRCPDCDAPLAEHLPEVDKIAKRKRVDGFRLLKELGLFLVLPIMFLAIVLGVLGLRDNPFGIQIIVSIDYTCFVFLLVFCDTKGSQGYSLGERAVRQKLPLLLWIHAGFLLIIFAGVTVAIALYPHLSPAWTQATGGGRWSSLPLVAYLLAGIGFVILYTQRFILRRILRRALEDERTNGGS